MSENIVLGKDTLKNILEEAFDEGWSSYQELKDEVISRLMEKCEQAKVPTPAYDPIYTAPQWTAPQESQENPQGNHFADMGYSVVGTGSTTNDINIISQNIPSEANIVTPTIPMIDFNNIRCQVSGDAYVPSIINIERMNYNTRVIN